MTKANYKPTVHLTLGVLTQWFIQLKIEAWTASHADVLRLVTSSSPRTSAQLSDHFRSLAVNLCFG